VMLSKVAAELGKIVEISIRINPAVDPKTHGKISTGGADAKFGIPWDRVPAAFALAAAQPNLRPIGLAAHIGSQLTDLSPVEDTIRRLGDLAGQMQAAGHDIKRIDCGGGLGVPYRGDAPPPPSPAHYAAMVARVTKGWTWRLMFEPGRMIVGNAGVMVSSVILTKEGASRHFVVVDAAMNDLLRPSLYNAWHDIKALRPKTERRIATVVGPICETGDTFAEDREIEAVEAGDRIAFMTAGAYGATMASTYNSRALVPEVMVSGDRWALVSARKDPAEMMALDSRAPWL
jgi:diaminopimelate decarboxylase